MILYLIYGFGMVTCTVYPRPRFTVRLTNERVGVFLARRSVQHLVYDFISFENPAPLVVQALQEWNYCTMHIFVN